MLNVIKPHCLKPGDTIATVSLSWGGAGDEELRWRYDLGKQRLTEQFGLKVIEMEHTLKGTKYLSEHPEKRASDLMQAFSDPAVKGIFSCIGGNDSIRLLPFVDVAVIANNPKVFLGYSDSTITHLMCLKAGLSSFYGPSILAEFAENNGIFSYTVNHLQKILFETNPVGQIKASEEWTGHYLAWTKENAKVSKKMEKNGPYRFLQGKGTVQGHLIGGCLDVLEMAKGTSLWIDDSLFDGAILFFETSEEMVRPALFESWLRDYAMQGILQKAKGMVFGKPYQGIFQQEYEQAIRNVLQEFSLFSLPVVCNLSFGHNEPMCILPYGAKAELDCDHQTFSILESGVV
ncbi:putative MccF-like protein (microcin C7 resistance) [Sphaerochaeta pleomorpha str. Grapes]|uniref:Putative MccF-like protein (Microcin C7 resistance) n=1 Tax=Sphaerochaeta pleomorpha (strain ATCC BAA-1885 / DSM 22778 / Grapes) TaxID=158190 RepID=G8QUL8_SPHPG|nr:S66 peptidase family protein [Sphaerochaeta pleomorpha]AEV30326.1 putative MccF-like protein (microcin C7 resistance) [Sphaerochaeta pleomorpha str. Grapes]